MNRRVEFEHWGTQQQHQGDSFEGFETDSARLTARGDTETSQTQAACPGGVYSKGAGSWGKADQVRWGRDWGRGGGRGRGGMGGGRGGGG